MTVTSTWNGEPAHPLAKGVTVYLTIPGCPLPPTAGSVKVGFMRVWTIVDPQAAAQEENPVIAAPDKRAAVQVNVVPGTVELSTTFVASPLQIVCAEADPEGAAVTVMENVQKLEHPLTSI